jgi:hypothetical protein
MLTAGQTPTLQDIKVVQNWPGTEPRPEPGSAINSKVPSQFTYSAGDGTSYGYGISHNSYVIQWTKLELPPPSRYDALAALRRSLLEATKLAFTHDQVLANKIPRHLVRTSSDVVVDYLTEVAECVLNHIRNEREHATLRDFPIDLVITHPAMWHPRAVNQTFRAATAAFERVFEKMNAKFDKIRLVSEPEACSQFTMRDAVEKSAANLRRVCWRLSGLTTLPRRLTTTAGRLFHRR